MKIAASLSAVLLILMVGCTTLQETSHQAGKKVGAGTKQVRPVFVGYRKPERKDFKVTLQFTASILPILQADIRPKAAGWLTQVYVNTGDRVTRGQIVAEMDHVQLENAVRQAEAELRSAQDLHRALFSSLEGSKSNVEKQRAIVENDRTNMARLGDLLHQGFVPQQQYDNSRTVYLSDKASLESLKAQMMSVKAQVSSQEAQVGRARAALAIASANLSDASLKAPFSGIVTLRNLDPGAFLSTAATSGSPGVVTITDVGRLKVMLNVADRDVPQAHLGQEALISADAYPDRTFRGKVTRMAGGLDPASRTLPVEVDIDNESGALAPGMFTRVTLLTAVYRGALVLPLDALVKEGDESFVWILEETPEGTKARKVHVTISNVQGSDVRVLEGLKGDERIVTDGKELIRPGAVLRAAPATGNSSTDRTSSTSEGKDQ